MNGQLRALATLVLGKEPLLPIEYEVGWALELAWTLWWRERSLAHPGMEPRFLGCPSCSLVTILTMLCQLLVCWHSSSFVPQLSMDFLLHHQTRPGWTLHHHPYPISHTQYSNMLQDFILPFIPWASSWSLSQWTAFKILLTMLYSSILCKCSHHFNLWAFMNFISLAPPINLFNSWLVCWQ